MEETEDKELKDEVVLFSDIIKWLGEDNERLLFKIVDILSTKGYSVWKNALKMFSDGKSKEEVLDYLKTEAVAEVLSK